MTVARPEPPWGLLDDDDERALERLLEPFIAGGCDVVVASDHAHTWARYRLPGAEEWSPPFMFTHGRW